MGVANTQIIEFYNVLPLVFSDLVKNKEQQRKIEDKLAITHNFPRGIFSEIMVENNRIEQLNENELILLVSILYEVTNDERIFPQHFFSQREINKASKYTYINQDEVYLPYTFEKIVASPSGRDFVTIMSYKEIRKLWLNNIFTYNFQSQRLSKKKLKKDGGLIEKADINQRSIKNITRLMMDGKYKSDTILLNILVDGNDHINFDEEQLTIFEGTTINLIDGMHRVQAILNVLEEQPDFEGYMNVAIKHYPLDEAQFLLGQINTVNRFDKTLIKHYMGESIGSQITKDLMHIPELRNRISIKTTIDRKLNYFTNFSILSDAIEASFEPKNNKDRYDIAEVLRKFFGYLIPAYDNEFISNHKETSKISWINHHNTFVGFIVIAHKLYVKYGKDFPVDEIVRIVDHINFSKEQSEFNDILTSQGKVNSNQIKVKIRKFFEDKVNTLLA